MQSIVQWILIPAAIAGSLSFLCARHVILKLAWRVHAISYPGGRRVHQYPVPLLGGAALAAAFLAAAFWYPGLSLTPQITALVAGFLIIVVMGVWDDLRELPWQAELLFQVAAALCLVAGGASLEYVNNPFGGAIDLSSPRISFCQTAACSFPLFGAGLTVVWVLAVTNAINWFDGSDGVAVSVSAFALGALAFLSIGPDVLQPAVAILAAAAMGAALGILPFNFPPARLFLGTSGAMGLGFLIAGLSVIAGAKLATSAMVLLLPASDMAYVMLSRMRHGMPLTRPDTRHFHFWLKKQGMHPRTVLLLILFATACFAVFSVVLVHPQKAIVLVAAWCVFVAVFLYLRR